MIKHSTSQAISLGFTILIIQTTNPANANDLAPDIYSDTYCLTSTDTRKIKIEFKKIIDRKGPWSGGYVKYGKNKPITIVFKSFSETIISKSSPTLAETVWLEIGKNGITGQYTMRTQGTSVESFTYKKINSAKEYDFIDATGALLDDDYECSFTK